MESKYSKETIEYTQLKKVSIASANNYSFYAVVLDATAGYKKYSNCICSLRIIDPTCTYEGNDDTEGTESTKSGKQSQNKGNMVTNSNYCCVTLFSNDLKQLPKIRKVGDIVRIINATALFIISTNNCNCSFYKGNRQFNVNLHYSSSICVFDGDEVYDEDTLKNPTERYKPYHCSKEGFFLTKEDEVQIQCMRDWVNKFFSNSTGIPPDMYVSLDKVKDQKSEFDVHCKVVKMEKSGGGFFKIQLRDQSGVCFNMNIKEKDDWNLHKDDTIRIRSVSVDTHHGKDLYLFLNQKSNIMKFLKHAKISNQLLDEVTQDEKVLKMMLCEEEKTILDRKKIISKVSDMYKDLAVTNLIDVFHGTKNNETLIRAHFYILNVQPYDVREFVQGFCSNCIKTFSLKNLETDSCKDEETKSNQINCPDCGVKSELIYMIQFLIKDESTEKMTEYYRIFGENNKTKFLSY